MKYILLVGLTIFLQQWGFSQCPDELDVEVMVISDDVQGDVLELIIDDESQEWEAVPICRGRKADFSYDIQSSGNSIRFLGLPSGKYFLQVSSSAGCSYSLSDPENLFEGFVINRK